MIDPKANCYNCEKDLNENDLNAGRCLDCGWLINAHRHVVDNSGFDSLGLCPRCQGAETRNGNLCLVCQNELRDDRS